MHTTILLPLSALLCVVTSVRYFDYAVPIPAKTPSGLNSPSLVSTPLLSSRRSKAVQFLVNDKGTPKGKYHFGYDTGGGGGSLGSSSYREEVREPNGTIKGFYGYVDPQGTLRVTEYVADSAGFRSKERKIELKNNLPQDEETVERLQFIGPIPRTLAQLFTTPTRTSSTY